MRQATINKMHIFIAMFFMSLVMSIQAPIFAPYAAKLGASSVMIGIMLGLASFTNLAGNLIAGPLVDKFGKKVFIVLPIFISGALFIAHALASDSTNLLILRSLNGFSLAFLIPAAFALLSGYAKNSHQQGKNMAINGILGTIASIVAPIVGGILGSQLGYANTYYVIGISLFLVGIYTTYNIREKENFTSVDPEQRSLSLMRVLQNPSLQMVFLTGFALMYIHGVVIYEVPYLAVEQGLSTAITGALFSFFGVGTFFSLSLFFINRFDPMKRLVFGLFGLCMTLFLLVTQLLALPFTLFLLGFFFGIMMPAMATALTETISSEGHGRAFGVMSAVYSLGMIISSFITGIVRDIISPYFVAFLIGMIVLSVIGYSMIQRNQTVVRRAHKI